jgi:Trp operon repressor
MKRYFYFRDVADEINDDDASASLMLPVENITGIGPASITTLNVYHKNVQNNQQNDFVQLTVTRGKLKDVCAELVAAMNGGPHHDGVTVVADIATTTNGSTSIQGNDKTVQARFLSNDITSCAITTY